MEEVLDVVPTLMTEKYLYTHKEKDLLSPNRTSRKFYFKYLTKLTIKSPTPKIEVVFSLTIGDR